MPVGLVLAYGAYEVTIGGHYVTTDNAYVGAATAQVAVRKAELDRAASYYNRRRELAATGAVSREELNTAETAFHGAQANLVAAEQALESQRVLIRGTAATDHPEARTAQRAQTEVPRVLPR